MPEKPDLVELAGDVTALIAVRIVELAQLKMNYHFTILLSGDEFFKWNWRTLQIPNYYEL